MPASEQAFGYRTRYRAALDMKGKLEKHTPIQYQFLWAILQDQKISSTAKTVATALLLKFRNHKTGCCNPSYNTIAKTVGIKRRAAINAVSQLKNCVPPWLHVASTNGGSQNHTSRFIFNEDRLVDGPKKASASDYTGARNGTGPSENTGASLGTNGARQIITPVHQVAHEPSMNHSKPLRRRRPTMAVWEELIKAAGDEVEHVKLDTLRWRQWADHFGFSPPTDGNFGWTLPKVGPWEKPT